MKLPPVQSIKLVKRLVVEREQLGIHATSLYILLECKHVRWGDPYGRDGKLVVNKSKVTCWLCSRHAVGNVRENETVSAMTLAEKEKKCHSQPK